MELYDNDQSRFLLAALTLNPKIIHDGVHNLADDGSDFSENRFHKWLFQAIYKLSNHDVISAADIMSYAQGVGKEEVIAEFKHNNLTAYLDSYCKLVDLRNIDSYYSSVRKMSILRKYKSSGFDTTRYESMSYDDFSTLSIKDIVDDYDGALAKIKNDFYRNDEIDETNMDERLMAVKEEFKKKPMWGADFVQDFHNPTARYLTRAVRGWQRGQLTCISCGSGMGKTTFGLAQLVNVCCDTIYDDVEGKWVRNPSFIKHGGLIIQYEMNARSEIAPRLMSTISAVPCYHILNGKYDPGEEERVDESIRILARSKITVVTMPNFTVDTVESYIKQYVLSPDKIQYVVFDYLSEQASASIDLVKKSGTQQRTDQILSQIASKLKDIAVLYQVAILTFTQVNANINTADILDAGVIASSRSVQNKLDCGIVMHSIRPKEQDIVDQCVESKSHGCSQFIKPNRILHIYKARFGACDPNIKIYIYLDLSTGRITEFFTTDKYSKEFYDEELNKRSPIVVTDNKGG